MRRALYVLFVFSSALIVRLYPTLMSDMPFSTDSWPSIRNTELLIERTPIDLGNDSVFDGYNNYWPANSLFGAVFSQVVCLEPKQGMVIIFPAIGAVAVLIFYTLVEGLFNAETALMASIIFATGFPHAIFTAGVTKETYGNPLYLLLILIFLRLKGGMGQILFFAIASIALALTHHLTPLVTVAILFCMASAQFISDLKNGLPTKKLSFPLVGVLATVTLACYLLYAHSGFKVQLTLSDWLSTASYQLVAFALAACLAPRKPSQSMKRSLLMCSAAAAIPLLIINVAVKTPIMPGAPVLPSRYLLYAIPFVLASPLVYMGYVEVKSVHSDHRVAAVFWLASILGLEGYAAFGNSVLGLGLACRAVNFLWPPLALLCAVGLHRLHLASRKLGSRRVIARLATATVLLTLAAIASLNSFNIYAAVSQGERYMGYFNVEVDVSQGLKYLRSKDGSPPRLLYTYEQMLRNGYVLYGGYSVDLPQNWTEKLNDLNLVYSNGHVNVHSE